MVNPVFGTGGMDIDSGGGFCVTVRQGVSWCVSPTRTTYVSLINTLLAGSATSDYSQDPGHKQKILTRQSFAGRLGAHLYKSRISSSPSVGNFSGYLGWK